MPSDEADKTVTVRVYFSDPEKLELAWPPGKKCDDHLEYCITYEEFTNIWRCLFVLDLPDMGHPDSDGSIRRAYLQGVFAGRFYRKPEDNPYGPGHGYSCHLRAPEWEKGRAEWGNARKTCPQITNGFE